MPMDIQYILRKLPHRYPFLLVDRVLECEKHVRIKALKNVTMNEPFFSGHFPARPVMPASGARRSASPNVMPAYAAHRSRRVTLVSPTPRLGMLTTRFIDTSSMGFTTARR